MVMQIPYQRYAPGEHSPDFVVPLGNRDETSTGGSAPPSLAAILACKRGYK